jgi:hypothetical protein
LRLNHASDAYRIAVQAKEAEDGESSKDDGKSQDTAARPNKAAGAGAFGIEGRTAEGAAKPGRYGQGEESRDDDRGDLRGDAGNGP